MNFSVYMTNEKLAYFYDLLSPDMYDFNCAELCAVKNGGEPYCCDSRHVIPLLYRDEIRWDRECGVHIWQTLNGEEVAKLELPLEVEPELEVYATCRYAPECPRKERALICRTFPFLPYFDENDELAGLTYNFFVEGKCPLVGRMDLKPNADYLENSCQYWQELLEIFPEDKALYTFESKEIRKRFAGGELPVFFNK